MPSKELISGEWKKVCSNADCHMTGIPQPIEGFSKDRSRSDGLESKCKKCGRARCAEYYANNREHCRAQQAEHRAQPEIKARTKVYNAEHRAQPEIKARRKAQNAAYRALPENKERRRQRRRERLRDDPAYRVKRNVCHSIYQALKANGWTKGGKTFDYLPYSPEELMEHLEKQFDEHMTRDNYGTYWHIDHIKPHVMFNYDSLDHPDFQKCWALENLQPLEARENMSKNSIYEGKRYYHNEAA